MNKLILTIFTLSIFSGLTAFAADDPDTLYRQGKYEEAGKIYTDLDMDNPKDIRFRFNRGCAAFQNSDFKTAEASFSSVLRRTDDKDIKFKAAYNLGNTSFKQGDFQSAAEYYKEAIEYNPENPDSRYNLELALREIEKQKKKEQEKSDNQKGEENKQESGDKEKQSDKKSKDQNKEQEGKEDKENNKGGEGQKAEQKEPEDLSGDLKATGNIPEQKEEQEQEQPGVTLDKKRAEAMLDNLKEDRSKFLRFQIPKDKQEGVGSGKNW